VTASTGLFRSALRDDAPDKAAGRFSYAGDLAVPGMLVGRTLRSPYAHAKIVSIDTASARRVPGVVAVITAADVPALKYYGLSVADQPVLARGEVRYAGEPVAAVCAADNAAATKALAAIDVQYDPLPAATDPDLVYDQDPFAELHLTSGDPGVRGAVSVTGTYTIGIQDQAFMAPEAGLAVPDGHGGVDLTVATQWLHSDRDQIAACLGLRDEQVRLHLGGVGGAFGGREDITLHIHACLLALLSGQPVKMRYSRTESFLGHPHRHPAKLWYRHEATPGGDLVRVDARLLYDGGPYRSTSHAVVTNAAAFAVGPYRVPNATVHAYAARTNNPLCGAMRGFGSPQIAVGHEAQMDRLAAALQLDPVQLRLRNALQPGDELITGQKLTGATPVREVIEAAAALPLPDPPVAAGLVRGVGFGVGFKNVLFSEGFDERSEAVVELTLRDGAPVAIVRCAAAEVGQGFVTVARQIAEYELARLGGPDELSVVVADATTVGIESSGSSSASRQTWMSGGAIQRACQLAVEQLMQLRRSRPEAALRDLLRDPIAARYTFRPRDTVPLDEHGQGDAFVAFIYSAHRAVVDVDPELGTVSVVAMATSQDAGRVLNPLAVQGQLEGGSAQGVGLAIFEELQTEEGVPLNTGFEDYVIPTTVDMPVVEWSCVEQAEPEAPYGAKGIGEGPAISSTPAVLAAIRAATGQELSSVPVKPEDIALGRG
jgi:CO/xanthine dehydrogenase Mo-binding subunit